MNQTFDERAATWDDDPKKVERARVAAESVRSLVELRSDMRVLEYGAGTGLLSQQLVDEIGPLTLADPSEGMRAVLAQKVDGGMFPGGQVSDLDLSQRVPEDRFDLVISLMALHHIPDLPPVLAGFAEILDAGGTFCAIDLEQEDGSFHKPGFDGHNGFDRDELAQLLSDAGFGPTTFEHCFDLDKNDRTYGLFAAVARRP